MSLPSGGGLESSSDIPTLVVGLNLEVDQVMGDGDTPSKEGLGVETSQPKFAVWMIQVGGGGGRDMTSDSSVNGLAVANQDLPNIDDSLCVG